MRTNLVRSVLLLASFTAFPAAAEVFKWIDAQGVVNYSNKPPKDAKGPVRVQDRVSTVKMEVPATPAPDAQRSLLQYRVDRLERELAAERRAGTGSSWAEIEAMEKWREKCIADRRVDCDDPDALSEAGGYGYATAYGYSAYAPYYGGSRRHGFKPRYMIVPGPYGIGAQAVPVPPRQPNFRRGPVQTHAFAGGGGHGGRGPTRR